MTGISGWRGAAAVVVIAFLAVCGAGLYAGGGKFPAVSTEKNIIKAMPAPSGSGAGDVDGRIAGLASRLKENPNDAEGWRMLGWSYFNTQRYAESAEAYARAVALEPANPDLQSAQAEAVVQAAGGQVTPSALANFESVLRRDPKEFRSRFYIALAREQAGDFTHALDLWQALLAEAPLDAGWRAEVTSHISELGPRTGRSVAPAPEVNQAGAASEAVGQQPAISEMLAKLESRLATQPFDRDGWAMMIRSLSVMGDREAALKALARASEIFANEPATVQRLTELAHGLGLAAD